jgi:hypothetical protein
MNSKTICTFETKIKNKKKGEKGISQGDIKGERESKKKG